LKYISCFRGAADFVLQPVLTCARYLRSAVQLPVETSTRILSDSTVLTSRVIPAGYADNHIIDFEIDLLKYNMLADFLLRWRIEDDIYINVCNALL
jgi:hypothetical protein